MDGSGPDSFDVEQYINQFDHHSAEYAAHFHDIYDHMREKCPVAHTQAQGGFWVVTRYEDITTVARDDATFSSEQGITIPTNRIPGMPPMTIPIDYDPPKSMEFRKLLNPLLSPRAMREAEPQIRQLATELVDAFIETGECDLVRDLAQPLTGITTLRLAGLPEEDFYTVYAPRREQQGESTGDPERMREAMVERHQEMSRRFQISIDAKRAAPFDGTVISHLVRAEVEGRAVEDWEIMAVVNLFLAGGLDTTQALLGNSWVFLGRNTDRRTELISNMSGLDNALEELLRYFAPQQALCRTATRDVELNGAQIKEGERVLMCWVSGNRDAAEFDRPDEIDFNREFNRHMTFGFGVHRCMGSNLARLEAKVCMEQVLTRLPDYKLVEPDVRRYPDIGIVEGYNAVPVTFTPARKQSS